MYYFVLFTIASAYKKWNFVAVLVLMVVQQLQYTGFLSHLLNKLALWFWLNHLVEILSLHGKERSEEWWAQTSGRGGKGNYNLSGKSARTSFFVWKQGLVPKITHHRGNPLYTFLGHQLTDWILMWSCDLRGQWLCPFVRRAPLGALFSPPASVFHLNKKSITSNGSIFPIGIGMRKWHNRCECT